MVILRIVDAYCYHCERVRRHTVTDKDPGRCNCLHCDTEQAMMVPLQSQSSLPEDVGRQITVAPPAPEMLSDVPPSGL